MLIQHWQQIKALFQQLLMQSASASYVQPQTGDETHWEYSEILYEKEAMRLHCALRHCNNKKILLSLEKHNIPRNHLRKYISGLTCQACMLSLRHQQYRTLKSTFSSSKQLAVNNRDLLGNYSEFEISILVPTVDIKQGVMVIIWLFCYLFLIQQVSCLQCKKASPWPFATSFQTNVRVTVLVTKLVLKIMVVTRSVLSKFMVGIKSAVLSYQHIITHCMINCTS